MVILPSFKAFTKNPLIVEFLRNSVFNRRNLFEVAKAHVKSIKETFNGSRFWRTPKYDVYDEFVARNSNQY